jgi:sulfate transport system substrate-binding protein
MELDAAKAYQNFLFSDAAQQRIAKLGYRPIDPRTARKAGVEFPAIDLVPITAIARDWNEANEKFFAENGVIDAILGAPRR